METDCVFIDVSDLPPPEPLAVAMAATERLRPGQYLHMHHWREPLLLYKRLIQKNFGYDTRSGQDDACEIFVWRLDDPAAQQAANVAAGQLPPWRE
ncbi:MAG: DUF2249 domain-containing protein [Gammaproteobacteria bacterium]|nr:DUF2249 domain-containing protein [Gammaproteobacteria bacterium]